MDKFKKIFDNLNPNEKRVIELAGQAEKLEKDKSSITDEKELEKIQKKIDDLNKERIELIESSNKKEGGVNVNIDSIEGTKYSIPEMDGTFSEASKNSDSNYYKVDKQGNVYILTDASVKRMINRSDSYLKPVFYFAEPKESDNGIKILELPKIDPNTGALIKKGSLEFTEEKGVNYSSISLEGVGSLTPDKKIKEGLDDKETGNKKPTEDKNTSKENIKLAEKELSKLKIDNSLVERRTNEWVNLGYDIQIAKKLSEIEGLIDLGEKRVNVLISEPGIKDQEKRLESSKKTLEENKKELEELLKINSPKNKWDSLTTIELFEQYGIVKNRSGELMDKEGNLLTEDQALEIIREKDLDSQKTKVEINKTPNETDEQKTQRIMGEISNLQNNENPKIEHETEKEIPIYWFEKDTKGNLWIDHNKISIEKRGIRFINLRWEVTSNKVVKEFKTKEEAIGEAEKIYNELLSKLEKEIDEDRKKKPFIYFALENSNNQILLDQFFNEETNKLDLRNIEENSIARQFKLLQELDKNEGYFKFNLLGYVKVIKNVAELRNEKGIEEYSDKAIYKIVGPNNEIVADNIQGYNEATRIYEEEIAKQKAIVEQEFEKTKEVSENSQEGEENNNTETNNENGENQNNQEVEKNGENTDGEGENNQNETNTEDNNKPGENIETNTLSTTEILKLEDILSRKETEMAKKFEGQKKFNTVIKALDIWEKFGQGEKGIKGYLKRMGKIAMNLALIGAISTVSVEIAAEAGKGTAAALGGGATKYIFTKIGIGLGLAVAFDGIGNKAHYDGRFKKYIPWIIGAASVGAATFMSGGAVGIAAGAGFLASKIYKGRYTTEKIEARQEKKIQEFRKKYEAGIPENKLKEVEKEYEKILKHYRRTRVWGKLGDAAIKLGIGTAVSVVSLEASGIAKDEITNIQTQNETTNTNLNPTEEPTNTGTDELNDKKFVNPFDQTNETEKVETDNFVTVNETESNEYIDHLKKQQDEIMNSPTENHVETKEMSVDFSSRGAIATIDNLKDQIRNEYPDISKAPENVREFMETDSTKMAIKLGFYNPESPDESAMIIKGSTLSFNQEGDLVMHDIKTGEDHTFLEGTHDETVDKYEGKMFDSDHSAEKIETATTTDVSESGHQGEGVTGTGDNSHVNETADKTETTNQEQATDNKEVTTDKQTTGEKETIIEHRALTTEELEQVKNIYNHNLDKLMDNSPESRWEYIQKNVTAERFMELTNKGEIKSDFHSLADHMKKLEEVTGVRPEGAQYLGGVLIKEAESIPNYIGRALEEALRKGVLDKVTL